MADRGSGSDSWQRKERKEDGKGGEKAAAWCLVPGLVGDSGCFLYSHISISTTRSPMMNRDLSSTGEAEAGGLSLG